MDNRGNEARAAVLEDRRNRARMRALKSAKIVFNNRWSIIDCMVRNLSDTGCCLQIGDPVGVPDKFELEVGGTKHACKVVWRTDNRVGVQFA
jgi:hypothetical protein